MLSWMKKKILGVDIHRKDFGHIWYYCSGNTAMIMYRALEALSNTKYKKIK